MSYSCSDSEREFVADVIKSPISHLKPFCEIINDRPRHLLSQCSVEWAKVDAENMLGVWMIDKVVMKYR